MIDLILYYVLPNVLLFGGIYFISKAFENIVWEFIVWNADNYYSDEDCL